MVFYGLWQIGVRRVRHVGREQLFVEKFAKFMIFQDLVAKVFQNLNDFINRTQPSHLTQFGGIHGPQTGFGPRIPVPKPYIDISRLLCDILVRSMYSMSRCSSTWFHEPCLQRPKRTSSTNHRSAFITQRYRKFRCRNRNEII